MNGLIGMAALSLVAGGLVACGPGEDRPEANAAAPLRVTVARVSAVDTAERLEAGGVVAAQESASISSRIVATIAEMRVKAGEEVRAGDILMTLDARDLTEHTVLARANAVGAEKALTQARTAKSSAEVEHRLAATSEQRIATLHARNSATDQERDEAEARLSAATARLAGTEAAIETAEANLASARAAVGVATATESFATVRAPFGGLVTERLADPGNLAAPGVPLVRIESGGARQVVVRVDEARVPYVRLGDRVSVLLDPAAEDAAEGEALQGVVAEVAREVGADQRTFMVKVGLSSSVTARTGSFARVLFRGAPRHALIIPAHAIHRHGQVSSVYVVQDGVARLRLIRAGHAVPDGVEVLAGLDVDEAIVVSPLAGLSDGRTVTVGTETTRTGGTP